MKVFVAGATGAVGRPLVRSLIAHGHDVVAMTRSAAKGVPLRALGAEVVIADALDADGVLRAVTAAKPHAVVNELTALENVRKYRNLNKEFAPTNRLRTRGTDNLIVAARAAGSSIVVSQSFGNWVYETGGSALKTERDPLMSDVPAKVTEAFGAIQHLEKATLGASGLTGVVLRYGGFYGPGTSLSLDGFFADEVRRRKLPVVGSGAGLWSFIHVDDAAEATVAAIEAGVSGVFNIVDDEPVAARDWIPALAEALGAKKPRHVPVWLARLAAGEFGVRAMTTMAGMSNAKAKSTFAWQPTYASYREGFRHGLGRPKAQLRSTG
jgi:nucleoside-diphosphate-sugar epimerase